MFIRKDLTLPQQAVQSCHACIELYRSHNPATQDVPNLVLLGVDNEADLANISQWLQKENISHVSFQEPYYNNQVTAIAAGPIYGPDRKLFRHFQLLKG